ncbi:MAG: helix-turn-helix transcriptional regulator [Proteobacteria bacterium]|nr:helix-turn-helix transcriptional regulator [Pseudomonadota bacterium]
MKKKKKDLNIAGQNIIISPGEMVKTLRELKGWSQNELAKKTGISQTNISAIENGKIQIGRDRAIIFARAFNVHPGSIMFSNYDMAA